MDARSLLALANLNKHDRYQADRAKLQTAKKEDWRWVGYDSTIGMGIVQSGNITRMGKVITNGYLVEGQPVEFNQDGQFGTIEGMQYVKPQPRSKPQYVPQTEPNTPSIATLFEGYKDGSSTLKLYVGGLTPEPIEVVTTNALASYQWKIDNTGEGNYDVAYTTFSSNCGIVGQFDFASTDLKVTPATPDLEQRVVVNSFIGGGIFVSASFEYFRGTENDGRVPFHLGAVPSGGWPVGSSGTASWVNGVRSGSGLLKHQVTNTSSAVVTTTGPSLSGSGVYVLPDGSTVPVFLNRSPRWTYSDARTLFAESENSFVYQVISQDTNAGPSSPVTNEYFYRNNGVTVKVAEGVTSLTSSAGVTDTATLGNPIEIEQASYDTRGRLVRGVIRTVLINTFVRNGRPSNPITGAYVVREIDLLAGTVQTVNYQGNPIPSNYVIPQLQAISGGMTQRIWHSSFNFEQ